MILRILTIFAAIFYIGCASNPMIPSTDQQIIQPTADEAQVVFMRSSFVGSAINGSLYEVADGKITFIGIIANSTKVSYKTTPGKHIFMVVSEAADFLEADLKAGKNYFSVVTPRMGAWKARFSLWPIKTNPEAKFNTDMSKFSSLKLGTKLVENSEASRAWYENNKESVRSKYEKYWPVWQKKSADDILKRTLLPEDGI